VPRDPGAPMPATPQAGLGLPSFCQAQAGLADALIWGKIRRARREDMAALGIGALRRLWGRGAAPEAAGDRPIVPEGETLPRELPPVNCPELGPFMRSLHDAGVLTGDDGPNQSGMGTYWRIQHLAYLAVHNFGHRGLRYRYDPHPNGPYSLGMACDFYRFDSMRDSDPIASEEWGRLTEFLDFAKNYRSLEWLSVAATLSYINGKMLTGEAKCSVDHDHSHRACLVELVHANRWEFAKEGIFRVYDSIKDTLSSDVRQVTV